ncbi:MAG: AAA family ATPase [Bradyrhizobiaceae bacterium]|nr:AAA family ATPase [Bradyrhizobiaceae bacterium]
MILTLAVSGYRSIRNLVLPLERLNVITGGNGTGKSSLYRALRLLADVAQGQAIAALALEGGLQSTLWAGPETVSKAVKRGDVPVQGTLRKNSVALRLGFASEDYGYAIDLGLPVMPDQYQYKRPSLFNRDPEIKAEAVWAGPTLRRSNVFASRANQVVQVLGLDGKKAVQIYDLAPYDSMMTHAADATAGRELLLLRERMRSWRFYDHFRTDHEAPARLSRVGTRTFALAGDGADLAAALQTTIENDDEALNAAIDDAFPGASIAIENTGGIFGLFMHQHGLLRPLSVSELSDGTLRYLLLAAALMTPRPPPLVVLNEPETSLHPDLIAPLGRLIVKASEQSQLIVVTHAATLVGQLRAAGGAVYELVKEAGETVARDAVAPPPPTWVWPSRG